MGIELSPSGHIPLNKKTLDAMSEEERAFWQNFLENVQHVILDERDSNAELPYAFPPDLFMTYQEAIARYDGAKYCQVQQLSKIFKCDLEL